MPERVCKICNETQILSGEIRSDTCSSCNLKYKKPRLGTGKDWRIDKNTGYIVKCIDGKWTLQHRHIMEKYLKRKLKKDEHIHHKNGVKIDNRIENLELMDKRDHHKKHFTSEKAKELSKLGHRKRWGHVTNF